MILISHADTQHSGAIVYLHKWCKKSVKILTTIATQNMARLNFKELYSDICKLGFNQVLPDYYSEYEDDFKLSLNDINSAFEAITTVRYSQPVNLSGLYILIFR